MKRMCDLRVENHKHDSVPRYYELHAVPHMYLPDTQRISYTHERFHAHVACVSTICDRLIAVIRHNSLEIQEKLVPPCANLSKQFFVAVSFSNLVSSDFIHFGWAAFVYGFCSHTHHFVHVRM